MWCWKCLPSKIEAVMYIGREQYGTIYWTNFYFALNSLPHPTTSTSTTTTKTSPYPKGLGLDPPGSPLVLLCCWLLAVVAVPVVPVVPVVAVAVAAVVVAAAFGGACGHAAAMEFLFWRWG